MCTRIFSQLFSEWSTTVIFCAVHPCVLYSCTYSPPADSRYPPVRAAATTPLTTGLMGASSSERKLGAGQKGCSFVSVHIQKNSSCFVTSFTFELNVFRSFSMNLWTWWRSLSLATLHILWGDPFGLSYQEGQVSAFSESWKCCCSLTDRAPPQKMLWWSVCVPKSCWPSPNSPKSFPLFCPPEIEKNQRDEGKEEEKFIDVVINKNMKLGQKVLIPVKQFPKVSDKAAE